MRNRVPSHAAATSRAAVPLAQDSLSTRRSRDTHLSMLHPQAAEANDIPTSAQRPRTAQDSRHPTVIVQLHQATRSSRTAQGSTVRAPATRADRANAPPVQRTQAAQPSRPLQPPARRSHVQAVEAGRRPAQSPVRLSYNQAMQAGRGSAQPVQHPPPAPPTRPAQPPVQRTQAGQASRFRAPPVQPTVAGPSNHAAAPVAERPETRVPYVPAPIPSRPPFRPVPNQVPASLASHPAAALQNPPAHSRDYHPYRDRSPVWAPRRPRSPQWPPGPPPWPRRESPERAPYRTRDPAGYAAQPIFPPVPLRVEQFNRNIDRIQAENRERRQQARLYQIAQARVAERPTDPVERPAEWPANQQDARRVFQPADEWQMALHQAWLDARPRPQPPPPPGSMISLSS